jgi:hypothetical protein
LSKETNIFLGNILESYESLTYNKIYGFYIKKYKKLDVKEGDTS